MKRKLDLWVDENANSFAEMGGFRRFEGYGVDFVPGCGIFWGWAEKIERHG